MTENEKEKIPSLSKSQTPNDLAKRNLHVVKMNANNMITPFLITTTLTRIHSVDTSSQKSLGPHAKKKIMKLGNAPSIPCTTNLTWPNHVSHALNIGQGRLAYFALLWFWQFDMDWLHWPSSTSIAIKPNHQFSFSSKEESPGWSWKKAITEYMPCHRTQAGFSPRLITKSSHFETSLSQTYANPLASTQAWCKIQTARWTNVPEVTCACHGIYSARKDPAWPVHDLR